MTELTDLFTAEYDDVATVRIAVVMKDGRTISKDYKPDDLAGIIGEAIERQLQQRGMSLVEAK